MNDVTALRGALSVTLAILLLPWSSSQAAKVPYSHGDPSPLEQCLLEIVNAARTNPAAEGRRLDAVATAYARDARASSPEYFTNLPSEFSAYPAAPPLAFNPALLSTARAHSSDMLANSYFAHDSLDGTQPADRILAAGYDFDLAGENISGMGVTSRGDVEECHYGLMIDNNNIEDETSHLGHRLNILDGDFTEIGIGYSGVRTNGDATEDFGTPSAPAAFIVGVAYTDRNANSLYDPGEGISNATVMPDTGMRYAVTSASGGFAIPIDPVATNTTNVTVPFDVETADWTDIEPYESSLRGRLLSNAPMIPVNLSWSGGGLGAAFLNQVSIRRPVLYKYTITGTDGWYYERTFLTCRNVKSDLVLSGAGQPVSGRGFAIVKGAQSLSFPVVPTVAYSNGLVLSPGSVSSSGLAPVYTSSSARVAVVDGDVLRIMGAGTATIAADQPGDAFYLPAKRVTRRLVVTKGAVSITFAQPDPVVYSPGRMVPLQASSTSGGAVAFSSSAPKVGRILGTNLTVLGAGTVVISAAVPATPNYAAASARRSIVISKASQTIAFTPQSTIGYRANGVAFLFASSTSGLEVALSSSNPKILAVSGSKGVIKGRGTVSVTARQGGNANFLPAEAVSATITVQ